MIYFATTLTFAFWLKYEFVCKEQYYWLMRVIGFRPMDRKGRHGRKQVLMEHAIPSPQWIAPPSIYSTAHSVFVFTSIIGPCHPAGTDLLRASAVSSVECGSLRTGQQLNIDLCSELCAHSIPVSLLPRDNTRLHAASSQWSQHLIQHHVHWPCPRQISAHRERQLWELHGETGHWLPDKVRQN